MSDFTALDNAITAIANEVIKKAITKTRIADVLTLLRNHISEIELTPGQNAEVRVNGTMFQWKLSGAATWTDLFDLSTLEGADGAPGPYFVFRVFNNEVIQIRLSNAAEADPWINLVFLEDITGPAGENGSPDTAAQIRDKINTLVGEERLAVSVLKDFVTAVVGQIQTEVPAANEFQFKNVGGVLRKSSDFDRKTSLVVNFDGDSIHCGEFFPNTTRVRRPIYAVDFSFNIVDVPPLHESRAIIHYSGDLIPSIMVPFGPETFVPPYTNTTAMIAAQASQEIGDFYTVDGVTFFRLDAKSGQISDYTTVQAVAGGKRWGTLPSWVILQGDAFLAGVDHRNVFTATYYDEIEINSVWRYQVVVLHNRAITNGNFDDQKPNLSLLLSMNFAQATTPLGTHSLINNMLIFANDFSPNVINPQLGLAAFDDLGGGNFAFRRTPIGGTPLELVNRTYVAVILSNLANKFLQETRNFTIIFRSAFFNQASDGSDTPIIGNVNIENSKGFSLSRRNFDSNRRLRLRVYNGALVSIDSNVQEILRNGTYYTGACKFEWNNGSRTVKMWIKSTANAVPLTNILTQTAAMAVAPVLPNNLRAFNLDSLFSQVTGASTSRSVANDQLEFYRIGVPDNDIITRIDTLEP